MGTQRAGIQIKNAGTTTDNIRQNLPARGQVTLEFTFAMIMVVFLALGMIWAFKWSGNDLIERRKAHETSLIGAGNPVPEHFYATKSIYATVNGDLYPLP